MLKKREHSQVRDALMTWYENLHKSVEHDAQTPIPSCAKVPGTKPLCRVARICLCSDAGTAIHRFGLKFCNCLKALCQRATEQHIMLGTGDLFCRLTGFLKDGSFLERADEFVHISIMHWKPYGPPARCMECRGMNSFGNIELYAFLQYRWPLQDTKLLKLRIV